MLLTRACIADETATLLTEAQRAYSRGDKVTAKQDFEIVLQIDPANKVAASYLRMIHATTPPSGGAEVEKGLSTVRIPKVELRDSTFGAALEYLKQSLEKQTQGRTRVNFVVQLPADVMNSQKVTLSLANAPFTEAVRYLGDLTGSQFVYEKYAVIVKKKGDEAAAASPVPSPN